MPELLTPHRASRVLLAISIIAVALDVSLRARQEPRPSFRSGVDVVQIDVSVLDKDHRPVRGLTAADFTVLENGKPQPIVGFTAIDLPDALGPSAGWTATVAPDAASNAASYGRLVVILTRPRSQVSRVRTPDPMD